LVISSEARKLIRSLHRRKGREAHGLFLVEGPRGVAACLDARRPWHLAVVSPSLGRTPAGVALAARLRAAGRVLDADDRELARLADTETPQGVLLVARWEPARLEAWSPPPEAVVVVLDGIQDPGNVGTLVRAAHALGALAVVALPGTADPWSPKAVRAAAGAILRLPVAAAAWEETRDWLRRHGFEVWGAGAEGEPLPRGGPRPPRAALVLGNEGAGLSDAVRAACDRIVSVPIGPAAESLNAAVAGAILLDRWRDA
jgi:TrmH family RNA methyltransferase